jgi:hypothetical protein
VWFSSGWEYLLFEWRKNICSEILAVHPRASWEFINHMKSEWIPHHGEHEFFLCEYHASALWERHLWLESLFDVDNMIEKTTTCHRLLDDASHPEPQLLKWESSRSPIGIVILSIPA